MNHQHRHRHRRNPSIIVIPVLYFILILIPSFFCQEDDEQYQSCSRLYTCGELQNISYPFWGNGRPQFCGREGFELRCVDNSISMIKSGSQEFRVLDINPFGHIMTVVRVDLFDNNESCPLISPTGITEINETQLQYVAQNVRFLDFFYDCDDDISSENINFFHCSTEEREITGFFTIPNDTYWNTQFRNLSNSCKMVTTRVPVSVAAFYGRLVQTRDFRVALEQGFDVQYNASNESCHQCILSGGICGSDRSNSSRFVCLCPDQPNYPQSCPPPPPPQPAPAGDSGPNMKAKIGIAFGAAFGGMGVTAIISFILLRQHKKKYALSSFVSGNSTGYSDQSSFSYKEKGDSLAGVRLFTYTELEVATNHFDSSKELGDGGFGTVYYGKLQDGRKVAVKRLYENNYKRVEQFMNEVDILAGLRHPNLVSLYGSTSRHSRELLLVYEYVSNGTLADHLHGHSSKPGSLPWSTRLKIAIETASALSYLHASEIVHRDVKTNNILLDDNFHVKVADFGLSRLFPMDVTHVSTAPQGTPGYVDPEYHQCYQLTDKSDVFSFGVVLIELISSMPAVDITRHRHEINLSNLAINKIQNKALQQLVDPNLGFEADYAVKKTINAVAELAFRCLQSDKDMRPCMVDVLEGLKSIENEGYGRNKAEEMDIPSDDAVLLKSGQLTLSPDSVTVNWTSSTTTPNASS